MNLAQSKSLESIKPFGVKDKLGYLFGEIGNDLMFIFANMYFMIFYTKVLGVSAAAPADPHLHRRPSNIRR